MGNLLRDLQTWWSPRRAVLSNGRAKPRKSRFALWMRRELKTDTREHLQEIAKSGANLERLLAMSEWASVLDVKAFFQNQRDAITKIPEHTEQARFRAACEWMVLAQFFKELELRIQRGHEAQRELAKRPVT